ncbi:MAG: DUF2284 domain-containing protein [Eubacteriales bacterium]|nr:DUF2284 domain-containing protein [Eubacteriales bacterium]
MSEDRIQQQIEEVLTQFPICEYSFGDVARIPFSEKVRYICENECERYGNCWACPPYCGEVPELTEKCRRYQRYCLFSTVTETEDAWSKEACLKVKHQHEDITRQIRNELKEQFKEMEFLVLSTGCTLCEHCSCPDAPCRHPKERLSSMESHGIVVIKMAEEAGICYNYGDNTVVYMSIILY